MSDRYEVVTYAVEVERFGRSFSEWVSIWSPGTVEFVSKRKRTCMSYSNALDVACNMTAQPDILKVRVIEFASDE